MHQEIGGWNFWGEIIYIYIKRKLYKTIFSQTQQQMKLLLNHGDAAEIWYMLVL